MRDERGPYCPIGVFDSGVGGLTVCRQIAATLPAESLLYLGDTARVPYGSKSATTVKRYARACARLLHDRGVKLLVVACNTASAFALDLLREELAIPTLGVVEPGALAACRNSASGRIGVIGTRGVIASNIYTETIVRMRSDAQVYSAACPLFVPFAEEGWTEGDAIMCVAKTYLSGLLARDIDTLVLGCTHYPLLRDVIAAIVGPGIRLVDSADETARAVANALRDAKLLNPKAEPGAHGFLVSDAPETFAQNGARFFGQSLERVEWVDVCEVK